MELTYKNLPIAGLLGSDDEQGYVEAIVSVYNNVDLGGDVIRYGAFGTSLARKLPKIVWHHDWMQPLGKTLEARELPPGDAQLPESIRQLGGLYVKGQFNLGTQRGRDAYSDLKFGSLDEFSIGYQTKKHTIDSESGVVELLELDLHEWSPVLLGMNPATALLSIKQAPLYSPTIAVSDSIDTFTTSTTVDDTGLKLADHEGRVLSLVPSVTARWGALASLEAKEGRPISTARRERLGTLRDVLRSGADDLESLLVETAPAPKDEPKSAESEATTDTAPPDGLRLYADYLHTLARLDGVLA